MRAVSDLCLEVLPGAWEPDPFLDDFFLIGNDLLLFHKKSIQNWISPPRQNRCLETQTTYGTHTWRRGLSAYGSIRSPSLVTTRVPGGEDSRKQGSAVCEKHVVSCMDIQQK